MIKLQLPPKKICKKIKLIKNIGFCKEFNVPCLCFFCEHVKKCRKEGMKCEYLEFNVVKINNKFAIRFLEKVKFFTEKAIRNTLFHLDKKSQAKYLLYFREINLLSTFTAPGDYTIIPFINFLIKNYEINSKEYVRNDFDVSTFDHSLISIFNYLLVSISNYNSWITLIENQDGCLLISRENIRDIKYIITLKDINKGIQYIVDRYKNHKERFRILDNSYKEVKRGKSTIVKKVDNSIHKYESPEYFFSLSEKMELPYIWAKYNSIDPYNGSVNLKSNVKNILIPHICDTGSVHALNPVNCYRISYPFHLNLLHLLKNLIVRDNFYRHHQIELKNFYIKFQQIFQRVLHQKTASYFIEERIIYDNVIMHLYQMEKDNIFISSKIIEDFSEKWQFQLKDGVLMGSVLFFAIISMYFQQLFSKKKQRGTWFEDYIEYIINSSVIGEVILRNESYGSGEIDFIANISDELYLIEAKNYGPWHAREGNDVYYIGSADFKRRLSKLQNSFDILDARLNYINNNKKDFKIPENVCIEKGIIVTSYEEMFLKIPEKYELMSIETFEKFLNFIPLERLNFEIKFNKEKDSIKHATDKKEGKNNNYII